MWIRPSDQRIVGENLAKARVRAGYTQQELARKLGKPQSFVSSYESGQRRIDVMEFIRITASLGADAAKVFREIAKGASSSRS